MYTITMPHFLFYIEHATGIARHLHVNTGLLLYRYICVDAVNVVPVHNKLHCSIA